MPLLSTHGPPADQDKALSETSSILSTAATDGSTVPPAGPTVPVPIASSASTGGGEAEAEAGRCGEGSGCCQKKQKKQECTASRAREPR